MGLHRCAETECTFFGQTTSRSCGCHKTDEEVLRGVIRELLSADDAMMAFLCGADPRALGEGEWQRQHEMRSKRRRAATDAARAAIA